MKKIIFFLALIVSNTVMATSSPQLLEFCNSAIKVMNNNYVTTNYYQTGDQATSLGTCLGYVSAVVDMYEGVAFCVPQNSTYEQYVRVTTKYINNNPEKLNLPAQAMVISALSNAFPCPKTNNK